MLINLGYAEERTDNQVQIQFNRPGEYEIDHISLHAKPIDSEQLNQEAADRKERAMEISTFEEGRVEGTINSSGSEMLVTTTPYSTGWQATINGESVDPVKVNLGFVGLPLVEGENTVTLTYQTPLLKLGAVISILGLLLLGANQFFYKRK